MGVLDWFRKPKPNIERVGTWKELGGYHAMFTSFGSDIYASATVRDCIRPLAEHTSKANAVCKDKRIEHILNVRPNMYMNGKDFLAKVRTRLELMNTAFIYIMRDDSARVIGLYPVPYSTFEALEYANGLFIEFSFLSGTKLVLPWEDLAVLRKDYNSSDISGDSNTAIMGGLELMNTLDQGLINAVKSTANLRGILKSSKGMLSDEDRKKSRETFVKDYMNLENEGGIAMLDSTLEFTPITMSPKTADWETKKEAREDIQRYFGVSNAIITSDYTEAQMEAFYDSRIEPFLVALSLELTGKIFTNREQAFSNKIVYESNRIQYASTSTKLAMVQLVDRGALTPNEWRAMFNLAPVEGGDEPIRRLDTAEVIPHTEGEDNGEDE